MDSVIHPLNNWAWRVGLRARLVKKKTKTKNKKQKTNPEILLAVSNTDELVSSFQASSSSSSSSFFFFTACTPMLCCESLMHVSETTIKLVI